MDGDCTIFDLRCKAGKYISLSLLTVGRAENLSSQSEPSGIFVDSRFTVCANWLIPGQPDLTPNT